MGRYQKLGIAVLAILILLVTGCADAVDVVPGEEMKREEKHVLFVTDSVNAERSEFVWEILQNCTERYSCQLTLAEVQAQTDKTSATLNQASEGLYDIVVIDCLASELASEWVLRNAGYYPDVQYVCLDVAQKTGRDLSNVTCVVWDDAAAYYYCGAVAALNAENSTVAFLAAESGSRAEMDFLAFYAGAQAVNNSIRALYYPMSKVSGAADAVMILDDAIEEKASVVCLQSGAFANTVTEILSEKAADTYIVFAQTALSKKTEYRDENVLVNFSFQSDMLLRELLEKCLAGYLKTGDTSMNWFNGALTMENGAAYPGIMDEEQRDMLRTVRRTARKDEIPFMPDPAWTQEERQERIQNAAEYK